MSDTVVGDLSLVTDFAVAGERIVVLDRISQSVSILRRVGRTWQSERNLGRKGGGPGELQSAIAVNFDSTNAMVSVLEVTGEIELFDTTGAYVRSEKVLLPCSSARVQSTLVRGERFIAQRCLGSAFSELADDTVYVLVASVSHHSPARLLAAQPVATVSGNWGSFFDADRPFAFNEDSVIFGAGLDDCVYKGALSDIKKLTKQCRDYTRYSVKKPTAFANRPAPNKASEFPDPLPLFTAVTFVGPKPALLRIATLDTTVLESADLPGHHAFVASLNHFVGCNAGGCLWYDEDTSRMAFLPTAEIAKLLAH